MPRKTKPLMSTQRRLANALNNKPKKTRKHFSVEEADNGFIISMREGDDFDNKRIQVAGNQQQVKDMIMKML